MKTQTRRSFIKRSAVGLGALSLPNLLPSHIWAADTPANSRPTVGFIGMGTQGRGLLGGFLGQASQVVAVCDVDTKRRDAAKRRVDEHYAGKSGSPSGGCAAYNDFRELIARKDIDAVCIATPDHWHAIMTVAALQSGKDVYCEKPLTHNIHESITVMNAVREHRRVLQTGSMQRSSSEFRIACELVRNGVIGKLQSVECSFGPSPVPCNLPEETMEPGLDWNLWVGPAPMRAYNSILSPRGVHDHFPRWRNYSEFGGGMVADWGAHHLDIAQWGLDMDASGPIKVVPPKSKEASFGGQLIYAGDLPVTHVQSGFGVDFKGADGRVQVNRGRFNFQCGGKTIAYRGRQDEDTSLSQQLKIAQQEFLQNAKVKLYVSQNHISDFLSCMKSRQPPITNEQVGGRSSICCHLLNLAYLHDQEIGWDPAKLEFTKGSGNPAWLTRDYRAPWKV